jgi:dihydrofolate reductase
LLLGRERVDALVPLVRPTASPLSRQRPSPPDEGDGAEAIPFCDDAVNVVTAARDQGNHCFLFGGGVLVHSPHAADAVDMLTVAVVPVLFGDGRPLFPGQHPGIKLRLADYTVGDGKVRLVYRRR